MRRRFKAEIYKPTVVLLAVHENPEQLHTIHV